MRHCEKKEIHDREEAPQTSKSQNNRQYFWHCLTQFFFNQHFPETILIL